MYLSQVTLQNIACFGQLTLDFTNPDGNKPCRWVVLLGENGTGKSTILQMLALSLLGRDMAQEIAGGTAWERLVRHGQIKGRTSLLLTTDRTDKRRKKAASGYQNDYRAAIEMGRTIRTGIADDIGNIKEDYQSLEETLYADDLKCGWFAAGYGPWRNMARLRLPGRSAQELKTTSRKAYRFATMFREDTALTQVGDWLVDLEFRLLKEPSDEFARRTLGVAVKALEKVLLGVHFKTITKDGEVIFEENGISVPLDRLSDGYRSVTSWVGDLVRRLVEAYPTDPLNAHGVVLIDELDIHLHPKWQRSIVEHVRALFPNLQFIVSSHSPFVAQDMTDDDKIIVLKREGNQVVAVQDSHSVTGWRVDQILTSYMFDLESTRDIEIAVTEQEYQRLLDMQASGSLSPGQKRKLNDLRDWLQEHRSGPGETPVADSVYYAAKTVLGILDEYLSR